MRSPTAGSRKTGSSWMADLSYCDRACNRCDEVECTATDATLGTQAPVRPCSIYTKTAGPLVASSLKMKHFWT